MKVWKTHHIFDHPWEMVVKAACRKYPNPLTTCVLGADVIERHIENGILYSHKLITSEWRFPGWITPFFGHRGPCYGSEWSEVNLETKEMVVRTVNVSLDKYVNVGEIVRYKPDPEDPNKTLQTQKATICIRGLPLIGQLEKLLAITIEQNAKKGRQAVEWVIERIKEEAKEIENSTDDLLVQTCRQIEDITKRGMEDLSKAAKMSFDHLQNLTPPPQTMPTL